MLTELFLSFATTFCKKHLFTVECFKITNVFYKVILLNQLVHISFYVEEMESYVYVELRFSSPNLKEFKNEIIYENKEMTQLRKKAMRAFKRNTKNKLYCEYVEKWFNMVEQIIIRGRFSDNQGTVL